jgi:hypothetical protein
MRGTSTQLIPSGHSDGGHTMADKRVIIFHHRHNPDGSFDSICPRCYRTVSSGLAEANLARDESRHTCSPADLDHAGIQAP